MKILIGGECFFIQETGGVSRIFREVVQRIKYIPEISSVALWQPLPPPAMQSVDELFDCHRGVWLWEDRRPFRLRKYLNRNVLSQCNKHLFNQLRADVYLSTYYSIPPDGMTGIAFVYDMTYERFADAFSVPDREKLLAKKRTCFERSARLLCISQQTKDDVVAYYNIPASKCRICYLGGSEFAAGKQIAAKADQDVVTIVYVGNWRTTYKNFAFMLTSLGTFAEKMESKCRLHVVSRIKPSANDLAAHSAVFKGDIVYYEKADDAKLRDLYCGADVFVYPSLWEGFGIPIVEALSCGLPVACSDIPVFHEVGGAAVEYFDPQDVEACAAAIARAVESRDAPENIEARIQRAGMFTWDKCEEVFAEAIKKVVG